MNNRKSKRRRIEHSSTASEASTSGSTNTQDLSSLPGDAYLQILSYLFTATSDAQPKTLVSLPEEVLLQIFSYLSPRELIQSTSLVSRFFNILSKDNSLWKPHCQSKALDSDTQPLIKHFKDQYHFEQIPYPNFFMPNPEYFYNWRSILITNCAFLGKETDLILKKLAKTMNHGTRLYTEDKFGYTEITSLSLHPVKDKNHSRNRNITKDSLKLKLFNVDPSHPQRLAKLSDSHCIFLAINLCEPDLRQAHEDLQKIKSNFIKASIIILGVYDSVSVSKRRIGNEELKQFALNNNIKLCVSVNLHEPKQALITVYDIIATIVKSQVELEPRFPKRLTDFRYN